MIEIIIIIIIIINLQANVAALLNMRATDRQGSLQKASTKSLTLNTEN
jgi:hypothetical protein